jgi:hypothetical protein
MLNCPGACRIDFLEFLRKASPIPLTLASVTGRLMRLLPLQMDLASLSNLYHLRLDIFFGGCVPDSL